MSLHLYGHLLLRRSRLSVAPHGFKHLQLSCKGFGIWNGLLLRQSRPFLTTPQSFDKRVYFPNKSPPSPPQPRPSPPKTRRRWVWWVFGIAGIAATITICGYSKVNKLDEAQIAAIKAWMADDYHLKTSKFTNADLVSRDDQYGGTSIFNFEYRDHAREIVCPLQWLISVWSVQIMQPDLNILRPYTPLPPLNGDPKGRIRFLIKNEPYGEVSNYIHGLRPGREKANAPYSSPETWKAGADSAGLRGPSIEQIIPKEVDCVLFLAGGTGIAPAMQMAYALGNRYRVEPKPTKKPRMTILWACKTPELMYGKSDQSKEIVEQDERKTCLVDKQDSGVYCSRNEDVTPLQQLELMKCEFECLDTLDLDVQLFVDSNGTYIDRENIERVLGPISEGKPTPEDKECRKLLLVAGPDGFVEHIAGMRKSPGFRGLLAQVKPHGWYICKL